jgi:hypothetical protein
MINSIQRNCFSRSQQLFKMSGNSPDFLKHEGSLPGTQNPATNLYMVPYKIIPYPQMFLLIFNIINQDLFLLSYKHSYLDLK